MNRTLELQDSQPRASDGTLLKRFCGARDDRAFAELVSRHGPMVYGVCLRALGQCHDADDAFQAVFLRLALRAGRLAEGELGGWLYTIARRVSANAIRSRQRRRWVFWSRTPELPAAFPLEVDVELDAALATLNEHERSAIILCHLEGLSRAEAAKALGCPEGTLSTRLSRGLEKLRRKLGKPPLAVLIVASLVIMPDELPASTLELVHPLRTGTLDDWASPGTLDLFRKADPMRHLHRVGPVVASFAAVGLVMVGVSFGWNLVHAQEDKPAKEKAKVVDRRARGEVPGGMRSPGDDEGMGGPSGRLGSSPLGDLPVVGGLNPNGSLSSSPLGNLPVVGGLSPSGSRSGGAGEGDVGRQGWDGPGEMGRDSGSGGSMSGGMPGGEEMVPLADAVRDFNQWAKGKPIGASQQPLQEDEVVAALLMQRHSSAASAAKAAQFRFEEIAKSRRIPKGWIFIAMEQLKDDPYMFDVWFVDLRIPLPNKNWIPVRIRDQKIRIRPVPTPMKVADGETALWVYRLRNASAESIVEMLSKTVGAKWPETKFTADARTNSVLISAPEARRKAIADTIQALDGLHK